MSKMIHLAFGSLAIVLSAGSLEASDLHPQLQTFFDSNKIYQVNIEGWNPQWMRPQDFPSARETAGSRLRITASRPDSTACGLPDASMPTLFEAQNFSVGLSGNKTLGTPKSSFKIKLKETRFLGMKTLNLKSMWNDVSQMREAIAWTFFRQAGVVAPGHTYAKFCINGRYLGLYSFIENIDKAFVKAHFQNGSGNLYYASWEESDLGPATLAYRRNQQGDDSGSRYFRNQDLDARTYSLRTNDDPEDDRRLQSYNDLATLIRVTHQRVPTAIESHFNVESYLRWAALNVLMGAWDNYWVTPSNYSLYNSGLGQGNSFQNLMERPYFHWIPWDYDNTFGISYDQRRWHDADLFSWPPQNQPLMTALMSIPKYSERYRQILRSILQTQFNPQAIQALQARFWRVIESSVYQESDTPRGQPFTGRQFTNDQVYWNGVQNHELQNGPQFIQGIYHYVVMRTESAWRQLNSTRPTSGRQ